jgi:hypothetical protein
MTNTIIRYDEFGARLGRRPAAALRLVLCTQSRSEAEAKLRMRSRLRKCASGDTFRAGGFMEENGKHERDAMRAHTPADIQQRIDSSLEERIRFYATQPKEAIARRIAELDEEWSIDRLLTRNAAGLALAGVTFTFLTGKRKWLLLSGLALSQLLMYGVQGWCVPAKVMRRFGIRTRTEIDTERYALKLLRGDFESVQAEEVHAKQYPAANVWSAVRS